MKLLGPLAIVFSGELLVLGVLQGATEFLPVSSSGHLVLAGAWLGLAHAEGSTAREVALHLGTLASVIVYCWRDLLAMLRSGSRGFWWLTTLSTAVTVALALLLQDTVRAAFEGTAAAGFGLLGTAVLLGLVAPRRDEGLVRDVSDIGPRDAILMGLFQTAALFPGVSRAGATIVGALVLGFRRPAAVRMAFLMSIPVVLGAVVHDAVLDDAGVALDDPGMPLAVLAAAITGLIALRVVTVYVDAVSLRRFALYCLCVGIAGILSAL